MTTGRAVQMFGLEVPAGDEPTPIVEFGEYPATIRLTMAALNPLEKVDGAADEFKGAVLKIIRIPEEDEDDDDSEDGYDDDMAHLLDEDESDEDDEEEVSELNGDDAKPSKASKVAALKAAVNGDSMEVDGAVAKKGKKVNGGAATEEDEDDDEDLEDLEDDSDDEDELPIPEEFILCTLDTKQVSLLASAMYHLSNTH
jgi:FK506-binding nuclear protein